MAGAPSPFAFASMAAIAAPAVDAPPDAVLERAAAGAFRALCHHLRVRSDAVANIDLMTVGGFCRNCLAKWMVLEARQLSKQLGSDGSYASAFLGNEQECQPTIEALDAFGYDEAARLVYGETYPEWKERHQTKASEDQLRRYKESAHLHATHDAEALKAAEGPHGSGKLSERVAVRLEAGAYLSLCRHLRARSDEVQNMDLMTVGGFCRNCLAKWLVVEARNISDQIGADGVMASFFRDEQRKVVRSLDAFGYDEAAQYVYGCTYPSWKKRHQKKATDAQMEKYNESKHLHAKHDKDLLATRSSDAKDAPSPTQALITNQGQTCVKGGSQSNSLLSDVCCQDVDALAAPSSEIAQPMASASRIARPPRGSLGLKVGILTVSDRAASNAYESGDLSGPAVEDALSRQILQMNATFADQCIISVDRLEKKIVADETADIQQALRQWSGKSPGGNATPGEAWDLVFTTGGTGFAPRDVTPEATTAILDRECHGLMSWASMELTAQQPLATLSRAAAGTCGSTLIVNLPGNPTGAAQVVEVLLPLLLHAIKALRDNN
ncbi:hypothetical protein ACHAXT_000880 [Thalassiosira profunda]